MPVAWRSMGEKFEAKTLREATHAFFFAVRTGYVILLLCIAHERKPADRIRRLMRWLKHDAANWFEFFSRRASASCVTRYLSGNRWLDHSPSERWSYQATSHLPKDGPTPNSRLSAQRVRNQNFHCKRKRLIIISENRVSIDE
jgi:hypothetical protein